MGRETKPMWACGKCGRAFANRNQTHSCAPPSTLEAHLAGKSPRVGEIYAAFLVMLERIGPVTVLPEKTRIAFQVRMSFAQLTLRRSWVLGHFVLAHRVEDPVFLRIDSLSPRNHVHHFRLDNPAQVEALSDYAREAYAVGRQDHLG